MDDVRGGWRRREVEASDEAGDEVGAEGLGPRSEEGIECFAAEHGDELVALECLPEIDGEIGRGDDAHAGDVAVDEVGWDVELLEHTERDGASAGFCDRRGVALDEESLDASAC